MTRSSSKSYLAAYASALVHVSDTPELKAMAIIVDEWRERAAKAERDSILARLTPPPMTAPQIIYLKANVAKLSRALRRQEQSTCYRCCHYQTHPPRCQLSKRYISPKQFSCNKYSHKYR